MIDVIDYQVVDIANDSTSISTTACYFFGWFVNTALSAHACPIMNGAIAIFTIPASAAAGSFCFFPRGIRFNSLTIDPNDAATGNVTFLFSKA